MTPTQATSGPVYATDGIHLASRSCPAGRHLGRDRALVHRLVRQHRLADDVADREDVRPTLVRIFWSAGMKPP